jgi:hypothetical protein
MKKIKYLLWLFVALFFFIPRVNAAEYIDPVYYIDAKIQDNGDMLVKELLVLDGEYNYFEFDKAYRTSMPTFTGSEENFEGNADIYNADGIENIKVYDVLYDGSWDFNDINRLNKQYTETSYATNGDYGVYTLNSLVNQENIRIYNPSDSGTKGFYLEYLVKNAIVVHNDVAELFWPFIDVNFSESIRNVEIH